MNKSDLIIVNFESYEMVTNAIRSFFYFGSAQSDISVILVDNFSSKETKDKLNNFCSKCGNIHFVSLEGESKSMLNGSNGSYLNFVGIDNGLKFVRPEADYVGVFHNDVLAYSKNWLDFLIEKICKEHFRACSYSYDELRINAMHCSGILMDWKYCSKLEIDWKPNMPKWDVGDGLTIKLRESVSNFFVCKNSINIPHVLDIVDNDPLIKKYDIFADKAIDDNNNLIFLHIGRGTLKYGRMYNKPGRTNYESWVKFGSEVLS